MGRHAAVRHPGPVGRALRAVLVARGDRPTVTRAGVAGMVAAAVLAIAPAAVLSASAAGAPSPAGALAVATQDTYAHRMQVSGWAYDRSATSAPVTVRVYVDGHFIGTARTTRATPWFNSVHHISGAHGFDLSFPWGPTAGVVGVYSAGVATSGPAYRIAGAYVTHVDPTAPQRIRAVAARYVGHARYVDGGASPATGFDCSGYTQYVFRIAQVALLPHNAEAQRRMARMHRVTASGARLGDLVFYMSGGSAYHVAIYAGGGMQYAAATPRDGIRYQHVWSSAVMYYRYV